MSYSEIWKAILSPKLTTQILVWNKKATKSLSKLTNMTTMFVICYNIVVLACFCLINHLFYGASILICCILLLWYVFRHITLDLGSTQDSKCSRKFAKIDHHNLDEKKKKLLYRHKWRKWQPWFRSKLFEFWVLSKLQKNLWILGKTHVFKHRNQCPI